MIASLDARYCNRHEPTIPWGFHWLLIPWKFVVYGTKSAIWHCRDRFEPIEDEI